MLIIRKCEETIDRLNTENAFHGTNHLCMGQEASCVGAVLALGDEDWIISNHRGHGFYLARCSYDVNRLLAEMFGLREGACMGLGGSMHISDADRHYLCSTGVVAGGVPISVGVAMDLKYHSLPGIAVSTFGDGASNQGMALESLNLASLWEVPVLFYCENNRYAVSSPSERFVANTTIWERAAGFGIRSMKVDGNDLPAVYNAVSQAREYITTERRPCFIEAETYRFNGHSRSDKLLYRSPQDEEPHRNADPILRYLDYLKNESLADDALMDQYSREAQQLVQEALGFCEASSGPLTLEEALSLVRSGVSR
ncbi:MAG: thiamine pyrophosphate-dependent dehydrogenase E1 component subunit alpha [Eubacteriaceae bacterium]|nr:thiamine pyrophosphate-dependent dehydrogenase E1 component subunit alpha [Eubacteriaceae bacterium]